MTLPYQQTIQLRTYVKTALTEALRSSFAQHPDESLRGTHINPEFSFEEVDYPGIVVNFRPRTNTAAGVGHSERRYDPDTDTYTRVTRRLYKGDVELRIYALSTLDRDLLYDSVIQVVAMSQLLAWSNHFNTRIYDPDEWARVNDQIEELGEAHLFNYLNINTDQLTDTGDTEGPAPWAPEDVLLYECGIMFPVFGEILSIPPDTHWTVIQKVVPYPYIGGLESVPDGADDPAPWVASTGAQD